MSTLTDQQVGDEFRANRFASGCFMFLTCVSEVWNNRGNLPSGSAFHCVKRDEQFHKVFVSGLARRLHDIDIGAADTFLNLDARLIIRKWTD